MRGLERGLERAFVRLGWLAPETITYVEIEAFIIFNLVKQMEQGVLAPAPVWSNLKTFPWSEFHRRFHWIAGGYPCQPFSLAGKLKGTDDPRHLWPHIAAGIRATRPVFGFFENVRNHINCGFREVREELEEMGYRVEAGIFSAAEAGAPHKRDRLFILAVDDTVCLRSGKEYEVQTGRDSPECTSEAVAYASGQGLQVGRIENARQEFETIERSCEFTQWAARPGNTQHEWEAPRVIESGMGFTVDGHNYQEDLLRMAGNGVVEQQAEIAFLTLFAKYTKRCTLI